MFADLNYLVKRAKEFKENEYPQLVSVCMTAAMNGQRITDPELLESYATLKALRLCGVTFSEVEAIVIACDGMDKYCQISRGEAEFK